MKHQITRVWVNNISDEPEAVGLGDYFTCPCGWRSSIVAYGGEKEALDHEQEENTGAAVSAPEGTAEASRD